MGVREEYLGYFKSHVEARRFERKMLANVPEVLPKHALKVKHGGERTDEFWRWLLEHLKSERG
jgi:hypothetical protein